jgi:hypothetical protein
MVRRWLLLLGAALFLLVGGDMVRAANSTDILAKALAFTDEEFHHLSPAALAARQRLLLSSDYTGIAVNAPASIRTGQHDKLPLVLAMRMSGDRDWEVGLRDNCILVGTNLHTGKVHFANGLASDKELSSRGGRIKQPKGPKPSGLAVVAAQIIELEPRTRLHLPWDAGLWSLGVLYYDWPSNTVTVTLEGNRPAERPVGRAIFPVSTGGDLPSYQPTAKTPPYPVAGAAFTVEAKTVQVQQQLIVHGSFTTTIKDYHLTFSPGSGPSGPAAIVPITFVILGLDWKFPRPFTWAVPVQDRSVAPGKIVHGAFAIDAMAGGVTPLDPGRYVAYIIMDGRIFGPQSFQVTNP